MKNGEKIPVGPGRCWHHFLSTYTWEKCGEISSYLFLLIAQIFPSIPSSPVVCLAGLTAWTSLCFLCTALSCTAILVCTVQTHTCTRILNTPGRDFVLRLFFWTYFEVIQRFTSRCDLEPVEVLKKSHISFTERNANHIIQTCTVPMLSRG